MAKETNVEGVNAAEAGPETNAPAVILVEPQLGENIGTAARAMGNFGLSDLRLVAPRDGWPNKKAVAAAACADAIVAGARVYGTTQEAIGDLHYVCATTARSRDLIKPVMAPEAAAVEMAVRTRSGHHCGMLFGPEKSGLGNDHVALCDVIVTAPVAPDFASLNLAQAVLLMAYEWIRQNPNPTLGRETEFDGPVREGLQMHRTRPATRAELIGLFEHLECELDASGFLRPVEKRPTMVRNVRNLIHRIGATEQEVRTLRGIVSSLARRGAGRGDAS